MYRFLYSLDLGHCTISLLSFEIILSFETLTKIGHTLQILGTYFYYKCHEFNHSKFRHFLHLGHCILIFFQMILPTFGHSDVFAISKVVIVMICNQLLSMGGSGQVLESKWPPPTPHLQDGLTNLGQTLVTRLNSTVA